MARDGKNRLRVFNAWLVGDGRILMHNGRLADSSNPWAQELKAAIKPARSKTQKNELDRNLVEYKGSLYDSSTDDTDDGMGLYWPALGVISAMIQVAHTTIKGSKQRVIAGVDTPMGVDRFPFTFKGYNRTRDTPDALYQSGKRFVATVVVNQGRVVRCRPCFEDWRVDVSLTFDEDRISRDEVSVILQSAGQHAGLGDWRPRFGRFSVEPKNEP